MVDTNDETQETFDTHWESLYASGKHLNKWPYDHVVSFIRRASANSPLASPEDTRVLEVGFGAGNNLFAAATEQYDVSGIEASVSAVQYAQRRFEAAGLVGDLQVGDFTQLPWADESFDVAIERLALAGTTYRGAQLAIAEVFRTLKPGGRFLFNCFGPRFGDVEVPHAEGHLRVADLSGSLEGVGAVTFYSRQGVADIFGGQPWLVDAIQLVTTESLIGPNDIQPNAISTEWRVVARKQSA